MREPPSYSLFLFLFQELKKYFRIQPKIMLVSRCILFRVNQIWNVGWAGVYGLARRVTHTSMAKMQTWHTLIDIKPTYVRIEDSYANASIIRWRRRQSSMSSCVDYWCQCLGCLVALDGKEDWISALSSTKLIKKNFRSALLQNANHKRNHSRERTSTL